MNKSGGIGMFFKKQQKGLKLKHKIMIAMVSCSLFIAAVIGFISITKSEDVLEDYAYEHAKLIVENHSKDLNNMIEEIENSVEGLALTTLLMLDDVQSLQTNADYVKNFQEEVRPIARQFAKETEGAMTIYLRFNPAFTEPTSGLFHADVYNDGILDELVPTDFSQYEPGDTKNVGWYYIPIQAKEPTWLDPYLNENIGVEIISYVIPLFKEGVEIGVVGMDINFNRFTEAIAEMKPMPSSYGALLNADEQFLIHPTYTEKDSLADVHTTLAQQVEEVESAAILTEIDGKEEIVSFSKLSNGFNLLLSSPKAEIYKDVDLMKRIIWLIACISIVLSILIAIYLSNKITKPVHNLIRDMKKVQSGDLTIQSDIQIKDEIGEIAMNFNQMTMQLRGMASNINSISSKVIQASSELTLTSEETAASSEEVTASIEEMAMGNSEQARSVQKGAEITRDLSDEAQELAVATDTIRILTDQLLIEQQTGAKVLYHLVETTQKNEQASEHIGMVISRLNDKTGTIVKVLETIQTIADQTNLLALNAAIEAARAGKAGEGFSVVANEIRTLANQSRESTSHIRQIVEDIFEDTRLTFDAMTEVQEATTKQVGVVSDVQQTIGNLSYSIDSINKLINENVQTIHIFTDDAHKLATEIENISGVSEEQAAASTEISVIMQNQVKEIESISTATTELHDLINELQKTVSEFKL